MQVEMRAHTHTHRPLSLHKPFHLTGEPFRPATPPPKQTHLGSVVTVSTPRRSPAGPEAVSHVCPAVPQHAVRSSQLHHGEGGEHPAIQPLAPAHPHLKRGGLPEEAPPPPTHTAELKPGTLQLQPD